MTKRPSYDQPHSLAADLLADTYFQLRVKDQRSFRKVLKGKATLQSVEASAKKKLGLALQALGALENPLFEQAYLRRMIYPKETAGMSKALATLKPSIFSPLTSGWEKFKDAFSNGKFRAVETDERGYSLLHYAAGYALRFDSYGHEDCEHSVFPCSEMLSLLLDAGCWPNVRSKRGETPLHYAVQMGILLPTEERRAKSSFRSFDKDQASIDQALLSGNSSLLEPLSSILAISRREGALLDLKDELHETALHKCAKNCGEPAALAATALLLKLGASPDITCARGQRPVDVAAEALKYESCSDSMKRGKEMLLLLRRATAAR